MARGHVRHREEYMHLPYRMEIYHDDGYWAGAFPDLPGLVAGHATWDGLQAAIEDAKRAYFAAAIESGRPIPEPRVPRPPEFSGRFVVRVPKSLHRQATQAAEREGMNLNSFVVAAIAKEVGRREERARQGAASTRRIVAGTR